VAKILVADDESVIVSLMSELLAEHNHTVLTALDGKRALEICLREKPELVISDIMMPIMDGYELCRQIKAMPQLKNTRIMLMTAGFFNPAATGGQYDYFVKKPFDIEEIETLLDNIFP
jgi:CheY-like chemotaxis protein